MLGLSLGHRSLHWLNLLFFYRAFHFFGGIFLEDRSHQLPQLGRPPGFEATLGMLTADAAVSFDADAKESRREILALKASLDAETLTLRADLALIKEKSASLGALAQERFLTLDQLIAGKPAFCLRRR